MPTQPEITVVLPIDQLNTVLDLLGTHPYNQVADLLINIRQQAGQQIQQMPQQARGNGEDRPFAS